MTGQKAFNKNRNTIENALQIFLKCQVCNASNDKWMANSKTSKLFANKVTTAQRSLERTTVGIT